MNDIKLDKIALTAIKETTRPFYFKPWKVFVDFTGCPKELEYCIPKGEDMRFGSYLYIEKSND